MTMKKAPSLETIRRITAEIPTPYHVYDEGMLRNNARRLNAAFAWNEGYKEYFAVKATPNPVLMSIFRQEGCGMDCSSMTELMLKYRCAAFFMRTECASLAMGFLTAEENEDIAYNEAPTENISAMLDAEEDEA
jgi:hypothetical protein